MRNLRSFNQNLIQIRTLQLPKKKKRSIILTTFAMALSSLLDLIGLALLGLLSVLTVNAATNINPKPDGRVQKVLELTPLGALPELDRILLLSVLTLLFFLTKTILSVYFLRKLYRILGKVASDLSSSALNKLLRSDLRSIKVQDSQSYLFVVTSGTDAVAFGLIASMCGIFTDLILLSAMFTALLYIDVKVALVSTLFFVMLGFALTKLLGSENRRIGRERVRTTIEFSNAFLESIGTIREWRARKRDDFIIGRITRVRERQALNAAQSAFLPNVSKFVLEGGVVLGIFLLSASQALSDDKTKTAAVLAIFITAGVRVVPSVLRIQQNFMNYESAQEVSAPFFSLLERLPDERAHNWRPINQNDIGFVDSRTEVKNLVFKYELSGSLVLDGLNFEIEPGQFVALVGKSGSGKSTLVDCLLGLLKPSSGEVLIGGFSIEEIQSTNPNYFSYVPQEILLINGSLRDNLIWGVEPDTLSSEVLWNAIERVGLADFFESKGGLDFEIAERGANLSGGQKQRIGIARALVTNPRFLVFDEVTSSLDAESEKVISNLISNLKNSCTVLVIAHHVETLKSADKIILLKNGKAEILNDLDSYFKDKSALENDLGLELE